MMTNIICLTCDTQFLFDCDRISSCPYCDRIGTITNIFFSKSGKQNGWMFSMNLNDDYFYNLCCDTLEVI